MRARPPTTDPTDPSPRPGPELSADEQAQGRERAALTAGGEPPGASADPHPAAEGLAEFHKALARGATREQASSQFFGRVIAAAAKGDERVIWTPEKHQARAEGRA